MNQFLLDFYFLYFQYVKGLRHLPFFFHGITDMKKSIHYILSNLKMLNLMRSTGLQRIRYPQPVGKYTCLYYTLFVLIRHLRVTSIYKNGTGINYLNCQCFTWTI